MDSYRKSGSSQTLSEYTSSAEASKVSSNVADEQAELVKILNKSRVNYTLGETYDTILSGFEITIQAKDFEKVGKLLDSKANLIVGETYAPAETEVVTNEVDVYETGIFDSSESEYQGDGVVVAILDTGLDYTHSAFSVDNFTTTNEAFTLDNVSEKVNDTLAADFTPGLTGEDVYVNKKVPYAYDYADKDPDVLPIDSEHGTHVAGIIAGKGRPYYRRCAQCAARHYESIFRYTDRRKDLLDFSGFGGLRQSRSRRHQYVPRYGRRLYQRSR